MTSSIRQILLGAGLVFSLTSAMAMAEEKPADPMEKVKEDLKKVKAVKVSGYVQGRYDINQSSKEGIKSDASGPANLNRFYIRRSRIKATYVGSEVAEASVQLDATAAGVSLKSAQVDLTEPWTPLKLRFSIGQQQIPFGYELQLGSADTMLPEKAQVTRKFFSEQYDLGIALSTKWKFLRVGLGVFNGNSGLDDKVASQTVQAWSDKNDDGVMDEGEISTKNISSISFVGYDRDKKLDFTGRLGVDFGKIGGGLSFYMGKFGNLPTVLTVDETGAYTNTDELNFIDKTRFSADVEVALDLHPKLGQTQLLLEATTGHGIISKGVAADVDAMGWQATLLQNLGPKLAFVFKVDQLNPDTSATDDLLVTTNIEPGLHIYPAKGFKVSLSYLMTLDKLGEDETNKEDNQLQMLFQGKF